MSHKKEKEQKKEAATMSHTKEKKNKRKKENYRVFFSLGLPLKVSSTEKLI